LKRAGNLWRQLTSFENLLQAAHRAAAGKRRRPDVAAFLMNLEGEVLAIQRELIEGTYRPGPYHNFVVTHPKRREISAARFRDRVVHHALTRVIEPIFERRFSRDSFACRKGFGTHRALSGARMGAAKYRYALKGDVRKYFASIDHEILKQLLARVIKCKPTLELAGRIIDGSCPQEEIISYFPGDDLFTPFERRRGLPLGNQTSQFFANVVLDQLDQFVNRQLRPGLYARYVDDFLLFDDSRERLIQFREAITRLLWKLRLEPHQRKFHIRLVSDGITFLGWRIFPDRTRLVRENVVRFRKRMRLLVRDFLEGKHGWQDVRQRVRAWIAHAAHGDTWKLRQTLFEQFAFGPAGARSDSARGVVDQRFIKPCGVEPQSERSGEPER